MSPQAGWYADPSGDATRLRYWDGAQWTDQHMPVPEGVSVEGAASQPKEEYAYQAYVESAPSQPTPMTPNPSVGYAPGCDGSMVMAPGQIYPMTETDRTLRLIAFVWNVLCTVGAGFLIIPLAWMIPMTVHSWGIYKGTKPNTVGFDVCTLIFIGLISGILLLCSKKEA